MSTGGRSENSEDSQRSNAGRSSERTEQQRQNSDDEVRTPPRRSKQLEMPLNVAVIGAPTFPMLSDSIEVCTGVGLVGKQVVEQLTLSALRPRFRISYLTNSRHQVSLPADAPQADSKALLSLLPSSSSASASSTQPDSATKASVHSHSLNELIRDLCQRALKAPLLVIDCTSDETIAKAYPILLQNGIHIATPNKKAFSGSLDLYDSLTSSQFPKGGLLYHEATVGAGLPLIGTLNDLVATGDEIIKIEGVFSGTLSYIFNEFSKPGSEGAKGAPAFSSVVKEAKEAGYTEPHPADDLSGTDVGRKLAILARRLGKGFPELKEGYASVPTDTLVPSGLEAVETGSAFVEALVEHDEAFEKRRADAHKRGKVLRYVGVVDAKNGKLQCGLQECVGAISLASYFDTELAQIRLRTPFCGIARW